MIQFTHDPNSSYARLATILLSGRFYCSLILAWNAPAFAAPNGKKESPIEISERYRSLETLARGLFYLETMYFNPDKVKQEDLVHNALRGVVDKLDPHTMLMPRKAFDQLTIDTQGKFGGVGIIVSQERGKLIVVSPIEDTPAYKAGILSGDEIVAIDGKEINLMKNSEAVDMMRGVPGSSITLTVIRKGAADPLDFKLLREVIKVKSVRSDLFAGEVLYTRITSFQENTANELIAAIKKRQKKVKGLIMDLRDNPGGLLDQAVRVSDAFIESGVIVSTVGRDPDRVEREFAHKRDTFAQFPIVVIVNRGSASASEIVAGALQDHERALIIGTTTFGKGSVQTLVSLPDGSGLKLTVARYYTPKDRSIQAKGIRPDIFVQRERPAAGAKKDQANKSEADLEGHIEGEDLSELAKLPGFTKDMKDWSESQKADYQLVTAYTYLRSYARFNTKHGLKPRKNDVAPATPQKKKKA